MVKINCSNLKELNTFCTIITADHLHYALALRQSLFRFEKDTFFYMLVVDKTGGIKELIENKYANTRVCYAAEICKNGIAKSIYTKYFQDDKDAFRWSMKPVFMNYLLREKNFEKVIYTDCDIHFYNDYHFLLDELDKYSVLITPHWRSSDPHADTPNFEILYTSGIYNGGFIGANRSGMAAMDWWAMACEFICIKDSSKGMFVDQVHLNLLPVYFDKIGIVGHRGCNVANWNMIECPRSKPENSEEVLVAGEYTIVFIHFSKSTVDGIVSGIDAILLPYLERYYAAINKFSNEMHDLLKVCTPVIVQPGNVMASKTRFRRAIGKFLKVYRNGD